MCSSVPRTGATSSSGSPSPTTSDLAARRDVRIELGSTTRQSRARAEHERALRRRGRRLAVRSRRCAAVVDLRRFAVEDERVVVVADRDHAGRPSTITRSNGGGTRISPVAVMHADHRRRLVGEHRLVEGLADELRLGVHVDLDAVEVEQLRVDRRQPRLAAGLHEQAADERARRGSARRRRRRRGARPLSVRSSIDLGDDVQAFGRARPSRSRAASSARRCRTRGRPSACRRRGPRARARSTAFDVGRLTSARSAIASALPRASDDAQPRAVHASARPRRPCRPCRDRRGSRRTRPCWFAFASASSRRSVWIFGRPAEDRRCGRARRRRTAAAAQALDRVAEALVEHADQRRHDEDAADRHEEHDEQEPPRRDPVVAERAGVERVRQRRHINMPNVSVPLSASSGLTPRTTTASAPSTMSAIAIAREQHDLRADAARHHVVEPIAQLLSQTVHCRAPIQSAGFNGVEQFIHFLHRVPAQRAMILLAVPGTALRRTQLCHDLEQIIERRLFHFHRRDAEAQRSIPANCPQFLSAPLRLGGKILLTKSPGYPDAPLPRAAACGP